MSVPKDNAQKLLKPHFWGWHHMMPVARPEYARNSYDASGEIGVMIESNQKKIRFFFY